MCDPVSISLGVGAALSATGSVMGGISADQQGHYAAKIADQNAKMDHLSSRDALERGRIEEQRQYRHNARAMGAQRVAIAANGIELDFGTAADLQTDTARAGWEDAQTIRENAVREAKGFEISAWNHTAQASADRAQGNAAMWKGVFDAGGTLLSSASQIGKYRAGQAA